MPKLLFKDNVSVCFSVYNQAILAAAQVVFAQFGYDCIVTGGMDGVHSLYSAHYRNMALDFRTNHVPPEKRGLIFDVLVKALPTPTFDVLWEDRGKPNEHIHCEVNCTVQEWKHA